MDSNPENSTYPPSMKGSAMHPLLLSEDPCYTALVRGEPRRVPLPKAYPLFIMLHDGAPLNLPHPPRCPVPRPRSQATCKTRYFLPQEGSLTVRSGLCQPNGQLTVMPDGVPALG